MPVHLHYFLNALKIEQARGKEKKKKKKALNKHSKLRTPTALKTYLQLEP